jgi:hypothetical protein
VTGHAELLVPKSRIEPLAAVIGSIVIGVFLTLAVRNIRHGEAVLPSLLWILLLALAAGTAIRKSGVRGFLVGIVSAFSGTQVLQVRPSADEPASLGIGFRLCRHTVIERQIPIRDIASIHWSTGQASDLARHDVNDWTVRVWYWHRDHEREFTEQKRGLRRAGQAVLIIGPPRVRHVTEALGQEVSNFLSDAAIPVSVEQPGFQTANSSAGADR